MNGDRSNPLSPEQRTALDALLRHGRTIEAIKLVRDATGMSLAEANGYVRGYTVAPATADFSDGAALGEPPAAFGEPAAFKAPPTAGTSGFAGAAGAPDKFARVDAFIRAGQKIQAIKAYREATGAGLSDAKTAVETRQFERFGGPPPKPPARGGSGRLFGNLILAGVIFIALIFVVRIVSTLVHAFPG